MPELVLAITLAVCCITDISQRRIYNAVVLPSLVAALVWYFLSGGLPGLVASLQGAFWGGMILLLPFALGGMGAGDVKLAAVIGAWMGTGFLFKAILLAFLLGGLMAVVILVRERRVVIFLKEIAIFLWNRLVLRCPALSPNCGAATVPYGVALGIGSLLAALYRW